MTDLAIAHWGEYCDGGGERVAWDLHRVLDAPLYVSHQDESIEPDDVSTTEVSCARVTKKMLEMGDPWRMVAHQIIWQLRPELRHVDTVVTSGNEPLAYVPPDGQTWVAYVHHTSRMATDLFHKYHDKFSGISIPLRYAAMGIRWGERQVYSNYATKPDLFVANSHLVAQRINRYWGVPKSKIRVVYPMVDCDVDVGEPGGDYYFTVSRLFPEKRIVDIAETFAETGQRLKIAGRGPEEDTITDVADSHDNIEYVGYVSEGEKARMFREAKATVFAAEGEDFGIVPIESMAHGTPVLGVNDGFTRHQVVDGKGGYVWDRGQLTGAIARMERDGVAWTPGQLQSFARRNFGRQRFRQQMHDAIESAREETRIDVDWETPSEGDVAEHQPAVSTDGGGRE